VFVTFEGPDGAGKSTALQAVAEALRTDGRKVVTTRQPGGSSLNVRDAILGGQPVEPLAELFLFLADRAQHVSEVIRPALQRGEIVLCDRYGDSTVVYQGHARGLSVPKLRELNQLATGGLAPDLTVLLDLDVDVALQRVTSPDRLDREPRAFHQAVRQGFLDEAEREPSRFVVVDASQAPDLVIRACLEAVRSRLEALARPRG
jgi:dTMP kinase